MWGDKRHLFGLSPDDLKQHAWIIGQSGTGKSTLVHNLAVQLIERGYGVGVIDPHATTVAGIVGEVPKRRTNEVVWIEPGDLSHAVGLNPLAPGEQDKRDQIVASVGATFDHLFEKFWGPQSAFVLRGCVGTLLDCPVELNPTLLSVYRLLSDVEYRKRAARFGSLPVRQFWHVFESWSETKQADAIAPLINKLDALTNSRALSYAFGQVNPKFDARRAMDERQVVLCNLSKGGMGPEESSIFGSLLVTAFELAGYARADLPRDERDALPPFFLFVDEFQTFGAATTFANIFSESRKAKLSLIASHQYIGQLAPDVRSAVVGNVGSKVCFRVGAEDAAFVAEQFRVPESMVLDLANYDVVAMPMWQGEQRDAFIGTTLPPLRVNPRSRGGKVVAESRRQFARKRHALERKLRR